MRLHQHSRQTWTNKWMKGSRRPNLRCGRPEGPRQQWPRLRAKHQQFDDLSLATPNSNSHFCASQCSWNVRTLHLCFTSPCDFTPDLLKHKVQIKNPFV